MEAQLVPDYRLEDQEKVFCPICGTEREYFDRSDCDGCEDNDETDENLFL